jgi:hypothetical protein
VISPQRIVPANKQANYTEEHHVVKESGAANGSIKGKNNVPIYYGWTAYLLEKKIFLFLQTYCASRNQLL